MKISFNFDLYFYFIFLGDDKIKNGVNTESTSVDKSETLTPSIVIPDEMDAPSSSQLVTPPKESTCWREVAVSGGE